MTSGSLCTRGDDLRGRYPAAVTIVLLTEQIPERRYAQSEPGVAVCDVRARAEQSHPQHDAQAPRPAPPGTVQRFGSREHQSLGNTATGNAVVNVGSETKDSRFELQYGDVIALSGDYFESAELMRLGAIPGRSGAGVGSRDEIIYALQEINSGGARFQKGGPWAGFRFSDEVQASVRTRYQRWSIASRGCGSELRKGVCGIPSEHRHGKAWGRAPAL